jgi:hypothetical protein
MDGTGESAPVGRPPARPMPRGHGARFRRTGNFHTFRGVEQSSSANASVSGAGLGTMAKIKCGICSRMGARLEAFGAQWTSSPATWGYFHTFRGVEQAPPGNASPLLRGVARGAATGID